MGKRRLEAVGMRTDGMSAFEYASRLLLLLDAPLEAVGPEHFDDDELPPLEDISDSEELPLLEDTCSDEGLQEDVTCKSVKKASMVPVTLLITFTLALALFFSFVTMESF